MINLCIFASGRGSNALNILESVANKALKKIKVVLLVCDNPKAYVLQIVKRFACPVLLVEEFERRYDLPPEKEIYIKNILKKKHVDIICLAGYMRIIKSELLRQFKGRIVNIHPSLLPKYPGLNAQKNALKNNEIQSGCTIHLVDEGIDTGKILGQKIVDINKNDTVESLSNKILCREHLLYIEVLNKISDDFESFIGNSEIL